VRERSFLGDAVRISVETEGGTTLNADIPTGGPRPAPPVGALVRLAWRDADVRLLTK
jgi:hypothetical protein